MAEFQIGDLVRTLDSAGIQHCTGIVTGFCGASSDKVRVALKGKKDPLTKDGAYIFPSTVLQKICLDEFLRNYKTTNPSPRYTDEEDTKMNMIDKNRLAIMNKFSIGDKIYTSFDVATPKEIFAFDYRNFRVGLKSHISAEGCEKFSRLWVDPLTIIDPDFHDKVNYTNCYRTPNRIPVPDRIIMSKDSKVTIVLWEDGTKTIVRCAENTTPDPYAAYCAAFAKKCYGSNSKLKKTIKKLTVLQDTKTKNQSGLNESLPPDPLQSRFRTMDLTYLKEEENG